MLNECKYVHYNLITNFVSVFRQGMSAIFSVFIVAKEPLKSIHAQFVVKACFFKLRKEKQALNISSISYTTIFRYKAIVMASFNKRI